MPLQRRVPKFGFKNINRKEYKGVNVSALQELADSKKITEIMADHRQRFVQGAIDNKIPADRAKKLFDLIEKFGGYGFNKSHSAAYALIAYQTAFLKTRAS